MGRNNQQYQQARLADRTPHYGLRKLSIGVASVLLSTTLYLGTTSASADTVTPTGSPATTETTTGDDGTTSTSATIGKPAGSGAVTEAKPSDQVALTEINKNDQGAGTESKQPAVTPATEVDQPGSTGITEINKHDQGAGTEVNQPVSKAGTEVNKVSQETGTEIDKPSTIATEINKNDQGAGTEVDPSGSKAVTEIKPSGVTIPTTVLATMDDDELGHQTPVKITIKNLDDPEAKDQVITTTVNWSRSDTNHDWSLAIGDQPWRAVDHLTGSLISYQGLQLIYDTAYLT